jgi:hypothetical protein
MSQEAKITPSKERVRYLLDRLPDDCTLEDIQYHLYVIQKIENGLESADSNPRISQADMEREFLRLARSRGQRRHATTSPKSLRTSHVIPSTTLAR